MFYRGNYLIKEDQLMLCSGFDFDDLNRQRSIYEVIRLIEGVPLFFEKHIGRMNNSSTLAGLQIRFDIKSTRELVRKLAESNGITVGNVKLVYPQTIEKKGSSILAYFIPHSYPSFEMYKEGVTMLSLVAERSNPNAKITNLSLRDRANKMIAENNIFEVLLVNEDGLITEGSRSNIFFIQNNQVITPPENLVLAGITQNLIIQICQNENIPFAEKKIAHPNLGSFSAAFITGTSPKVLPVNKIDDFRYHTGNPVVLKIMRKYDEMIEDYLSKNK